MSASRKSDLLENYLRAHPQVPVPEIVTHFRGQYDAQYIREICRLVRGPAPNDPAPLLREILVLFKWPPGIVLSVLVKYLGIQRASCLLTALCGHVVHPAAVRYHSEPQRKGEFTKTDTRAILRFLEEHENADVRAYTVYFPLESRRVKDSSR